jgi:hypothetical protein
MGSLYFLAKSVIVWLGVDDRKADNGFSYFAKVRAPLSRKWKDEIASPADSGWQGVIELHNRPYWRRLWIIQEFANANDIEIRCGLHRIAWKDWLYATEVLTEALSRISYGTQTTIETSSARMIQSIRGPDQRYRSLEYILNVSFEAECFNPVDRVYGIIGMINTDPLTEPVYPYEHQSIIYGRRAYNPDSHYQLPRAPEDVYSTPELIIDYSKGICDVYADVMHYHSDYPYHENRLAKAGKPPRTMCLSHLVQHALGMQMLTPPELPDESATSFACIRAEGSKRDTVRALGPLLTTDLTASEIGNWIKSQGLFSSPSSKKSLEKISSQTERLNTSGHLNQVRGVVKTTDLNAHIPPREQIYPMLVRGRNLAVVPSNTEPGDTLCQFQQTDICVVATHSRLSPSMAVSSYTSLSGDPDTFHASIHLADANGSATLVGRALILRMPAEIPRKKSELGSTQALILVCLRCMRIRALKWSVVYVRCNSYRFDDLSSVDITNYAFVCVDH